MRVTNSLLFAAIIVFGALALTANAAYPVFKEREAKEKLAHDARQILSPESNRNTELLATIEKDFQAGALTGAKFEVAAWETISRAACCWASTATS
jgi:hypothetical protein